MEPSEATALIELDGGEPLRYNQVVSEMTGKRWTPPPRIYVYHPGVIQQTKLLKEYRKLDGLVAKLAAQTGKPANEVVAALSKVAALTPRKNATAALKKFIESSKPPAVKGKSAPKKLTVKEQNALLRMYAGMAKDPNRYTGVQSASSAAASFANDYQFHPKWLKSLTVSANAPSDLWKAALLSEEARYLRTYYDLFVLDDSYKESAVAQWGDVTKLAPSENWRFVLRIRRCPACKATLGTAECNAVLDPVQKTQCQDLGPLTMHLGNLRDTINAITFYRGSAQESYSVLVRPSTTITGPSEGGVWLNGKRARVYEAAAKLLMREPGVLEIAKGTKKVTYKAGKLLGFQEGKVSFYGRCPFCVPVSVWLHVTGTEEQFPLVAFHGPYGKSTNAGVEARAASMNELLNAGVGATEVKLKDLSNGLVMGDFNLDWAPDEGSPETQQQMANSLYEGFKKLNFLPIVEGGVATSLISIHGQGEKWKTVDASATTNFTSSAYDNLFLKGDSLQKHHVHSAVIDVISWIEAHLDDFELSAEEKPPDGFKLLPAKTQAFYIYHRYVSDHLPILCEILVQGMPDTSRAARDAQELLARIRQESRQAKAEFTFDVVMSYEAVIDISLAGDEFDNYTKRDEDPSRYARVVGTVFAHQGGYLIIRCSPDGKSALWLSHKPELAGEPIGGRLLEKFLALHPVGTRVVIEVLNPKFLQ